MLVKHKLVRVCITFCMLLLLTVPAAAWTGRVVHVADGDTVHVEPAQGGKRVEVRLYGIDCPEKEQPYGMAATELIRKVALYKRVEVEEKDKDRYGRTVAVIVMSDGSYLQDGLMKNGLAWVYTRYCKDQALKTRWTALEKEAVAKRAGLWRDLGSSCPPVAPWVWRKKNR